MAKKMEWYDVTAYLLLVVGGLNWGLVGLFDFNLVSWLFGTGVFAKIVYIAVGISALYGGATLFKLSAKKK